MQNAETMTLAAIEKDPWAAVQLPLPLGANRQLLTAARSAAQRCEGEAWRIIRTHDREDADSAGYAAEMRFMAGEAGARVLEIEDKLAALAAPARPRLGSSPSLAAKER
jgi:hypothetical protein